MLFNELKLGQRFKIISEDDPADISEGEIVEIYQLQNGIVAGHIAVQFNDALETWAAGAPNQNLPATITLLN